MQNVIDPKVALDAIDRMNAKIDQVVASVAAGTVTAREVTLPGATQSRGPTPAEGVPIAEAQVKPVAGASAHTPPAATVAVPPAPAARTDAEIFDQVAAFLDPAQLGPVFVSTPIRGKVYIGKYPTFAEILASTRIMPPNDGATLNATLEVYAIVGELQQSIRGWLPANSPLLAALQAHIGNADKWPPLQTFSLLNQRDPRVQTDLIELWTQYIGWKSAATPTDDDLEKYYGRAATAGF